MLRLILVRHGETAWNAQGRYQGQLDVPLSDVGRNQIHCLASRFTDENIDLIYASDLKRAWETADLINKKIETRMIPEERLREMNFGILEGLTFDEAQTRYADVITAWMEDYNQPPPGGETYDAFSERVSSFLDEIQQKHPNETICLVAHGGSLGEIIRLALGMCAEKRWSFALDNASLSELNLGEDGYAVLKRLNDKCHLEIKIPNTAG